MVRELDSWECLALMLTRSLFFATATALVAQAPIAQDGAVALKQRWLAEVVGAAEPSLSTPIAWEAGSFTSLRHHEAWMPLVDGEGLGTALRGTGLTFAGGWAKNGWTIQGRALAFKEYETNASRLRIHEFELSRRTRNGWQFGIKQGPMDWGYGMAGGYLMGASHLPFARLFLETPKRALSVFGISLGRWQVQTFLGRLEWE
ncbi:MAG: hypothetical protein Q8O00_01665, partial [Holophaga sp.]|nr:hypothetical protein [Holophaga sp.]